MALMCQWKSTRKAKSDHATLVYLFQAEILSLLPIRRSNKHRLTYTSRIQLQSCTKHTIEPQYDCILWRDISRHHKKQGKGKQACVNARHKCQHPHCCSSNTMIHLAWRWVSQTTHVHTLNSLSRMNTFSDATRWYLQPIAPTRIHLFPLLECTEKNWWNVIRAEQFSESHYNFCKQ